MAPPPRPAPSSSKRTKDSLLMPPPPRPPKRTASTSNIPTIRFPDQGPAPDEDEDEDGDDDVESDNDTITDSPPINPFSTLTPQTQTHLNTLVSNLSSTEFCCGGSIRVSELKNPIRLRFDISSGRTWSDAVTEKVQFPLDPATTSGLETLLQTSSPHGVMKADAFALDIHPHDLGILDTVAKTLCFAEAGGGVRADLKSLNIQTPGMTQRPVALPPGCTDEGFGTLLISLPCKFEGADLVVGKDDQTRSFTWSSGSTDSLTWVAYLKTCSSIIRPHLSGTRMTLTYSLHLPFTSLMRQPTTGGTPPLATTLITMLQDPNFLPRGGILGFHCQEKYQHTSKSLSDSKLPPFSLRGMDFSLFSALASISHSSLAYKLKISVAPILGTEAWDDYLFSTSSSSSSPPSGEDITRVGTKFHRLKMMTRPLGVNEEPSKWTNRYWPFVEKKGVVWLNEAVHEGWEIALVGMKEGEEARELVWQYSCVVLLIEVVPVGR